MKSCLVSRITSKTSESRAVPKLEDSAVLSGSCVDCGAATCSGGGFLDPPLFVDVVPVLSDRLTSIVLVDSDTGLELSVSVDETD